MSSYYSYDHQMQILLHKISYVMTEKVKNIIKLDKIFQNSPKTVHDQANNCTTLLRSWKKSYYSTRSYIENSGVGSRWEFDKMILFELVDHVANISQDIANLGLVFLQFENIFSNRMKSIIREPEEVDNIMKRVYQLIDYVLTLDYDVFKPGNLENWQATLEYFYKFVGKVEIKANKVLDNCISSLRFVNLFPKIFIYLFIYSSQHGYIVTKLN